MKIKLSISVLLLTYFGALKCADELEINLLNQGEPICNDEGFELYNGNCYKAMDDKLKFDESKTDCENIPPAGSAKLASIHDNQTNHFLLDLVKPQNLLLGMKFNGTSTVLNYTWADGTPYDFSNFPSDYEDSIIRPLLGECVMMQQSGQWVNKKCEENDIPHICQKLANEKPTVVPPTEVPPNKCPSNTWNTAAGKLTSPGYPYDYRGDSTVLNCFYKFALDVPISITFIELSTCGTGYSVISVYEGLDEQGPVIGNLSGGSYILPVTFNSSKNSMFMHFTSSARGKWRADWGPHPTA